MTTHRTCSNCARAHAPFVVSDSPPVALCEPCSTEGATIRTRKTRTYTAIIEVELQAPADATPSEVGKHIDACLWELGYEAPGISVNEVLVRCTETSAR